MCDFEFLVNFGFFKDNFRVLTLCGEDCGRRGIRECVPMFFDALEVMICARCCSIRGW